MLNRIVIINSELYGKADILIGDSTSIQLEADSNVGKSSLINTLNFLYIPDKHSMKFEGGRSLKESIKHYFKTVSQSFIIFEINKSGYTYCILVKTTANSEIEYYKFDTSYNEEYFFEKTDKGFSPYKFEKVLENILLDTNSKPQQLSPEELYKVVYSDKKENKPVVLTTDKITRTRKALSNNFSKIYRYLLKSSEINEDEFKRALLIADNKQDEKLIVFADRSKRQIYELRQTKNEIDILRSITKDFEILKRVNDDYNSLKKYCGKLKFSFIQQFNVEMKFIEEQLETSSDLSRQINIHKLNIDETLKTKRDLHLANVTRCKTQLEFANTELGNINAELEIIKQYDKGTLEFSGLIAKRQKLKTENAELLNELNKIQKQKITEAQLNSEISKASREEQQLENKIKDYDKLLGQNISDDVETKIRINNILSRKILDLKADKNILSKATEFSDSLKVFDGEINLSKIEFADIETIEEVRKQFDEKSTALENLKATLKIVKEYNAKQKEYENRENEIKEPQAIFDKVQNKEQYIKQKEEAVKKIGDIEKEKLKESDEAFKVEQEIGKQQILLKNSTDKYDGYKSRKTTLRLSFGRASNFDVAEVEELINKNIDEAFETLEKEYGKLINQKLSRHEQYLNVNKDLKSDIKEIDQFIDYIQKRINSIGDLEYTAKELLQTVSTQFTKPTADFLALYNDFQRFIRKYNDELDEFPVSNITHLSIKAEDNQKEIESLKKIAAIESIGDLFFQTPEQEENLRALEDKFREGKEIAFDDLFDLKLILEIDGEKKPPVDLNKQVESRTTDRVLKLFLFLSIIRRLIENSADNKVVLYIDELGEIGPHNVKQIINYCSQYNFIPIFAAPRQIEGIEKYYVIKKSSKKQPLKVDDWNVKRTKYKNAK